MDYSAHDPGLMVRPPPLCWFGTSQSCWRSFPAVAIVPFCFYIAMRIGSQAFRKSPEVMRRPSFCRGAASANWAITLTQWRSGRCGHSRATLKRRRLDELVGKLKKRRRSLCGLIVLGGVQFLAELSWAPLP